MAIATQRIFVFDRDELSDRMLSIADDVCGLAPRGRNELVTHDQQPKVAPLGMALDDYAVAFWPGELVCLRYLFVRRQVRRDTATKIAVLRLDDDGQTDFLRRFPGVFGAGYDAAIGSRYT